MTGIITRVIVLVWLAVVAATVVVLLIGRQFPSTILMSWTDSTPMNESFTDILALDRGQAISVTLPADFPLAQQMQLQECGANYYVIFPNSSASSFYTWRLLGEDILTNVEYPAAVDSSTARIGRRAVSPDGRWLFVPYDRLGILTRIGTDERVLLLPEDVSVSTGQPGAWSPDSRWLLWPYELAGDRVRWLRFDAQTRQIAQIEIAGEATFIDDERRGIWSPDSRTFATIQRADAHTDLLLIDPANLAVRRLSIAMLAQEMAWLPDSTGLVVFANEEPSAALRPSLLDTSTEELRPLVDASYPGSATSNRAAYTPTWSTDGQMLALFTSDEPSQSAPITLRMIDRNGQEQLAAPLPSRTRYPAEVQFWSADGVYFALHDRARGTLLRFNIRTGDMHEFGDSIERVIAVLATEDALILVRAGRPGRIVERLPWDENAVHPIRRIDGTQTVFSLCQPEP